MNHRNCTYRRLTTLARAAVLSLVVSPAARAADLHVPGDFATIQAAVDAASPGDSVFVDGGIHGPVLVGVADLSLIASNDATIDAGGSGRCIEITAAGVTVDGFIVRHGDTGIHVGSSGAWIVRNVAHENYGAGIGVFGNQNTIERNKLQRNAQGLILNPFTTGNLIQANVAVANSFNGYIALLSSGNTWEGNTARKSNTGFFTQSGAATGIGDVYIDNIAEDNRFNGFYSQVGRGNTFQRNLARRNGGSGFDMFTTATGNTFEENRSNRNGLYGYADSSAGAGTAGTGNTYTANTCANNLAGPSNPAGLCR